MPLMPLVFASRPRHDPDVYRYVVRDAKIFPVTDVTDRNVLWTSIPSEAREILDAIAVYAVPAGPCGEPLEPTLTEAGRPAGQFYDWLLKELTP